MAGKKQTKVKTPKAAVVLKGEEYSIIGKPLPRVDAKAKVTGEAKYAG